MKKVVLLQPPFFRAAGSHNDRAPLELAYASKMLEDAAIEHVVVNADYLGSTKHIPWARLFESDNVAAYRDAVDGRSPLLDQTVELVMQYEPEQVVIAAGDSCVPTKDFGSPYIAARVSERLRRYGVRTIGIGPIFIKDPVFFRDHFDFVFTSLVNRSLVDVITGDKPDVITGWPIGTIPTFKHTAPHCESDYVMTNFGCYAGCTFCMAPLTTGGVVQFQSVPTVIQDIFSRNPSLNPHKSLYFGDMIFPLNLRRLKSFAEVLDGAGVTFACESRTDLIREETVALMKTIGVRTVKLGIESADDETLVAMNKNQTIAKEESAIELLRAGGMRIVGYLILGDFYGSVEAMERSIERARLLDVDHYVVNISSYQSFGWDDRRYDNHFSMTAARRQRVPDSMVRRMLALQEERKNPTVDLLHATR